MRNKRVNTYKWFKSKHGEPRKRLSRVLIKAFAFEVSHATFRFRWHGALQFAEYTLKKTLIWWRNVAFQMFKSRVASGVWKWRGVFGVLVLTTGWNLFWEAEREYSGASLRVAWVVSLKQIASRTFASLKNYLKKGQSHDHAHINSQRQPIKCHCGKNKKNENEFDYIS